MRRSAIRNAQENSRTACGVASYCSHDHGIDRINSKATHSSGGAPDAQVPSRIDSTSIRTSVNPGSS